MAALLLDSHALLTQTLLIEHVVGLVENQDAKLRHIELSARNDILDSSRSSHNDGGPDGLITNKSTRDGGGNVQVGDESSDSPDDTLNLARQLSTRGQGEGLGLLGLAEVDPRQYRGDEGGSLASARLGLGEHVSRRIAKHQRKRLALDLGGLLEIEGSETSEEVLRSAQSCC